MATTMEVLGVSSGEHGDATKKVGALVKDAEAKALWQSELRSKHLHQAGPKGASDGCEVSAFKMGRRGSGRREERERKEGGAGGEGGREGKEVGTQGGTQTG